MSEYIVYLVEDCEQHAAETLEKLNEYKYDYNDENYPFDFRWLRGSVPGEWREEPHSFYDSTIIGQIEEQIAIESAEGNRVGILLDTLLTEEDIKRTVLSYYAQASLAREIFYEFNDRIPIYFITATATFGGQSSVIMGKNLSDRYIKQQRLAWDPVETLRTELKRLFSFYRDYYRNVDTMENGEGINHEPEMELV